MSESRRERRANNPEIRARAEKFKTAQVNLSSDIGGGYGIGAPNAKPATGTSPAVNPFYQPKEVGLTRTSKFYSPFFYREWDRTVWRDACNQAMLMGYCSLLGTLYTWAYQSSAFIRSQFTAYDTARQKVPIFITDQKGNKLDDWTEEICNKVWFNDLCKEILFSKFWGFQGLNFDPLLNKTYKYPMQQIDPINRSLRQGTYSFTDGISFMEDPHLLFVQPSTSQEDFLGFMQTITRVWIDMNENNTNWVQAARRLAYPIMGIGYPQGDGGYLTDTNGNIIPHPITGEPQLANIFEEEARQLAETLDPSKAYIFPYTRDAQGNMQKAVEVDITPTNSGRAYSVFLDFNTESKNEIREWLKGGTLTGDAGKFGTKGLGKVHQDNWEIVQNANIEYILKVLNDPEDFLRKISIFYKNFPKDIKFEINRIKELETEDIERYSQVLNQNGKRFTNAFFEAQGLNQEYFEDAPEAQQEQIAGKEDLKDIKINLAMPKKTILQSKKKSF